MSADAGDASLRELVAALPQLVWIADADGTVRYRTEPDPGVHPADRDRREREWSYSVAQGRPYDQEIRLRRPDGTWRWFLSRANPVRDESGAVVRWYGTDTDIEARKRAEQHLRFLADAGEMLAAPGAAPPVQALVERLILEIAELATIFLPRTDGTLEAAALAHRDPRGLAIWAEARRMYPLRSGDLVVRVYESGRPVLMETIDPGLFERLARDDRHRSMLHEFNVASVVFAPIAARDGRVLGALQLANGPNERRLDAADLRFAETLAGRIALALESARVFEREKRISETFQEAALPRTLPNVPGVALTRVYRAAQSDLEVGGDWYDAMILPDGRLLLSIGDVAGKGLDAAVMMASVRTTIRTAALLAASPAGVIAVAARAVPLAAPGVFVTAWVGVLDPATRRLTYACAGHPPPMVRDPGGTVYVLDGAPHPPLGVEGAEPPRAHEITLGADSALILYTDGIVEADRDVIGGEQRLRDAIAHDGFARAANPAQFLVDGVLRGEARDDVAILVATLGERDHWSFWSHDAYAGHGARAQFVACLRTSGAEGDLASAELIFGELVGNVVRHAPGPIDVDLVWENGDAVLHVLDRGAHFSAAAALPADDFSEGGRGLFLVAALARDVRNEPLPNRGNHVRVVLPVTRP